MNNSRKLKLSQFTPAVWVLFPSPEYFGSRKNIKFYRFTNACLQLYQNAQVFRKWVSFDEECCPGFWVPFYLLLSLSCYLLGSCNHLKVSYSEAVSDINLAF